MTYVATGIVESSQEINYAKLNILKRMMII